MAFFLSENERNIAERPSERQLSALMISHKNLPTNFVDNYVGKLGVSRKNPLETDTAYFCLKNIQYLNILKSYGYAGFVMLGQ